MRLDWCQLLSAKRFSDDLRPKGKQAKPDWIVDSRTEIERDYDRVLFSTPLRRLRDKTQVFPLEKHDSVRNRLTHSHEVTNLARSVGNYIAHGSLGQTIRSEIRQAIAKGGEGRSVSDPSGEMVLRDLPAMLAAISLSHDLGNPPFGHQGEEAIRRWVQANKDRLKLFEGLDAKYHEDFLKFEGNAQTVRVITRLQVVQDDLGLNLTYGTLGALLKYTRASFSSAVNQNASTKKFGFFASEEPVVGAIWKQTGLEEGIRHPLTFIMEACDDVAYSVLDAEDAVKKQIVSFADVFDALSQSDGSADEVFAYVLQKASDDHRKSALSSLTPVERNDVAMQKFRVHAINALMSSVIRKFEASYDDIMAGEYVGSLADDCTGSSLIKALKKFDRENAYNNQSVRELELTGFNTLNELMTLLWEGISEHADHEGVLRDMSPFGAYAYTRIAENYRRVFEGRLDTLRDKTELPRRYGQLQLLTDMISGMTDKYAIKLLDELRSYRVGPSAN